MWTINPITNQLEQVFQGRLISVSENAQENANGTKFRVGSVQVPSGKIVSCRIYEKNFEKGMKIGESYRSTATQYASANGDIQIDILVSHLTQAERASLDDFGVKVAETAEVAGQAI